MHGLKGQSMQVCVLSGQTWHTGTIFKRSLKTLAWAPDKQCMSHIFICHLFVFTASRINELNDAKGLHIVSTGYKSLLNLHQIQTKPGQGKPCETKKLFAFLSVIKIISPYFRLLLLNAAYKSISGLAI